MPDSQLESIMWDIWLDYRDEMKCDKSFSLNEELLNYSQSNQFITSGDFGNFPKNTPPEITSQTSTDCARLDASAVQLKQIQITN
jgi:hypothetical protein